MNTTIETESSCFDVKIADDQADLMPGELGIELTNHAEETLYAIVKVGDVLNMLAEWASKQGGH